MSRRGYTILSGLLSTLIIVVGVAFLPTGVEKAMAFVVGLLAGLLINVTAGNASRR